MTVQARGQRAARDPVTMGERTWKSVMPSFSGAMQIANKAQQDRHEKMFASMSGGVAEMLRQTQQDRHEKMFASMSGGVAEMLRSSAHATSHYRAQGITAQSILLSDRYRELTKTAISDLTGSVAPDDVIDSFLGDVQDIELTSDAWSAINDAAPEVAAAIEEHAASCGIAWLDRETFRDALATLIWGLYLFAWLVGLPTLLAPGPQAALITALFLPEVQPPSIIDRVDRKLDKYWPDTKPPDAAQ